MDTNFDVIVAGGGPAGSSVANFLRQKGRSVLVLEREKFPRFHIGESLLPFANDVWKELGVYEHIDLDTDIRSLISVQPNAWWFRTAHHELGHAYYFMSSSRPEVPPILRQGANRAMHEAIGDLAAIAAGQMPYLKAVGILPADKK